MNFNETEFLNEDVFGKKSFQIAWVIIGILLSLVGIMLMFFPSIFIQKEYYQFSSLLLKFGVFLIGSAIIIIFKSKIISLNQNKKLNQIENLFSKEVEKYSMDIGSWVFFKQYNLLIGQESLIYYKKLLFAVLLSALWMFYLFYPNDESYYGLSSIISFDISFVSYLFIILVLIFIVIFSLSVYSKFFEKKIILIDKNKGSIYSIKFGPYLIVSKKKGLFNIPKFELDIEIFKKLIIEIDEFDKQYFINKNIENKLETNGNVNILLQNQDTTINSIYKIHILRIPIENIKKSIIIPDEKKYSLFKLILPLNNWKGNIFSFQSELRSFILYNKVNKLEELEKEQENAQENEKENEQKNNEVKLGKKIFPGFLKKNNENIIEIDEKQTGYLIFGSLPLLFIKNILQWC